MTAGHSGRGAPGPPGFVGLDRACGMQREAVHLRTQGLATFNRGGHQPELELLVRPLHKQSVEEQAVEVRINIQNTAEPLDKGHGPGLAVEDACLTTPQALPCEQGAQEDSEHL